MLTSDKIHRYKNGHEFFRYIPGDREQRITAFSLPGLRVERAGSDSHRVTLRRCYLVLLSVTYRHPAQREPRHLGPLPLRGLRRGAALQHRLPEQEAAGEL